MFCPYCGKEAAADDIFCSRCGRRLGETKQAVEIPSLPSPIRALNTRSLYLIDNDDILRIGTLFYLTVISAVVAVGLSIAVVTTLGAGSWVALAVIFALILVPITSELRANRLKRLVALPKEVLVKHIGVEAIPWTSVNYIAIKGREVTFRFDSGWASATLEQPDVSLLSARAAAQLGDRFTSASSSPSRLSPTAKLVILTLGLFILTQAVMIAASLAPVSPSEEALYANVYTSAKQSLGTTPLQEWGAIFLNNVQIALTSLVPGFGFLILTISSYNTGIVIQIAAMFDHVTPAEFLFILYILPHSWVEELSYPLSAALGMLALTWGKQSYSEFADWETRASTRVSLGFAVVAIMLAVAATLEVTEPMLGVDALYLWIPVLLAGSLIALASSRYRLYKPP